MTEINFRYLFSWLKLIFKTIDLPVYLFSKLQVLWNISKRLTVIRVRNQYLFKLWQMVLSGWWTGSYFLNWFILLSPCFSTELNKRYYSLTTKVSLHIGGTGLQSIWQLLGKPSHLKSISHLPANCLEPYNGEWFLWATVHS